VLNAINIIETWGLLNKKIETKKNAPKTWGYCMKKIGQKEPHLPFRMREDGAGSFLTLVVTKLVTLKRDKKLRVNEVRNCNED